LIEVTKELEEKYKISKVEMQKDIQREINDLRLKKEAGEINEKKFKIEEAVLMSKIDELTKEFDELRNGLKTLKVGAII
jgi:virulence-associated protein VapD